MEETQPKKLWLAYLEMYTDGLTLQQIATHYGITRERVRQCLTDIPQYHEYKKAKSLNSQIPIECKNCHHKRFVSRVYKDKAFCNKDCYFEYKRANRLIEFAAITEKHCNKCNTTKPISEFHIKRRLTTPYYSSVCKSCWCVVTTNWRKRNPEKTAVMLKRAADKYQTKLRKDPEKYEALKAALRKSYKDNMLLNPNYNKDRYDKLKKDPVKYAKRLAAQKVSHNKYRNKLKAKKALLPDPRISERTFKL